MKIEKIETWTVSKWLVIRVTCEDGTYGVGEGNFWGYADATEVIAKRLSEDFRLDLPLSRAFSKKCEKFAFPNFLDFACLHNNVVTSEHTVPRK